MDWITAFQVELYGIWAISCILLCALFIRDYWDEAGYVELIYVMGIVSILGMIVLWYTGEWAWYTSGKLHPISWYEVLSIETKRYHSTYLTSLIRGAILLFSLFCMCIHRSYFATSKQCTVWEYPVIIIIITIVMYAMVNMQELMIAVLTLEAMTITLYVMASLHRTSNLTMEGALRFFFPGALSASMMLMGVSIIYAITGTTYLRNISTALLLDGTTPLTYIAIVLILSNILFKFALAPMHVWVGDVFQGAHGYFASYIAIVTKLPVLVLFIKISEYILAVVPYVHQVISIIAVISLYISALYGIRELNFKRFWGITSISHMSYVTLAVCMNDHIGISLAVIYMIIYLTSALGIWTIVLRVHKKPGHDVTLHEFFTWLPRLSTVNLTKSAFTLGIVYLFLSAAGIPPALGFAPKFMILNHIYNHGDVWMAAVIYVSQIISTVYYLRIIRFAMFVTPSDPHSLEAFTLPRGGERLVFVVAIIINMLFGYYLLDITVWMQLLSFSFLRTLYFP